MSSRDKHDGEGDGDGNDSNSNYSFESAFCEMHQMYNDVLCHVIIPEDDTHPEFGKASEEGEMPILIRTNSGNLSKQGSYKSFQSVFSHKEQDESAETEEEKKTLDSRKDSYISFRSAYALSSIGSSTGISLGSSYEDDDLSYTDDEPSSINEPNFRENAHTLNNLDPNRTSLCMPLKMKSSNVNRTTHYFENSESQKDVFSFIGRDIVIVSQSTALPSLACSEVSALSSVASGFSSY